MSALVWLLNLDGADELADGAPHDPFAALERRPALADALTPLVGRHPVLRRGARAAPGSRGLAFIPTRSAMAALARAGAVPSTAPAHEVLRAAMDRRFAHALPGGVPGAQAISSLAELLRAREVAGEVVVKRLFGFAGRGHLRMPPGPVAPDALALLARALHEDGAVTVEPWLDRTGDFAIHGYLSPGGACTLGRPTVQVISPRGIWRGTQRASADDLTAAEVQQLSSLATDAAAALRSAGFFGPFGLDAMRWHAPRRGAELVRCELNARYTMGWAVGMGSDRPDLGAEPG